MTLKDIEEQLKNLRPSTDVPKNLAERVIFAVSEHALKKQRRKLIWQYLGHGFTSVIVFYFAINWIAPDVTSKLMVISGALVLAMFWLLFKVSGVEHKQHFGRAALSAATFGFLIAFTGLVTLQPSAELESNDSLDVLPSMPEIIQQADDETDEKENIIGPMDEDKPVEDYEGDGFFGNVTEINPQEKFVFITSLLDTGEELTMPVPIGVYYKGQLSELEIGDRVYVEDKFIRVVDENGNVETKNQLPVKES